MRVSLEIILFSCDDFLTHKPIFKKKNANKIQNKPTR